MAWNSPFALAQGALSVPLSAQVQRWEARASQIDPRVTADESIQFLLEKEGKPQDLQQAIFDLFSMSLKITKYFFCKVVRSLKTPWCL